MKHFLIVCALLGAVVIAGCKSKAPAEDVFVPAENLYNEAMDKLQEQSYKEAAEAFQKVEQEHPFSEWATRALVMEAYSYFEGGEYEEAITACERFIHLHPRNENSSYMTYLKAAALYYQILPVQKDQAVTEEAKLALMEVVQKYPNTAYARDAKIKHDLTVDHLAGKEMEIGRYYLSKRKVSAALNRFRVVIDDYQTTTHIAEALYRMIEGYVALGVLDEAKRYGAVLGYNYADSPWYQRAYDLLGTKLKASEQQAQAEKGQVRVRPIAVEKVNLQ
jgi:outer membrane protein assembly factor BamD